VAAGLRPLLSDPIPTEITAQLKRLTHLPAHRGCFCMARKSSWAISSADGYLTGGASIGQSDTVCVGQVRSGKGLGSAQLVTILDEAIVLATDVVTSGVTSATTSGVTSEVTTEVTDAVLLIRGSLVRPRTTRSCG
jgi:hypothetical protein